MIGGVSPLRALRGTLLEAAPAPKVSGWYCRRCDVWGSAPVARARCWNCDRWDVELGRVTPEPPGGAHHVRWSDDG